MSYVIEKLWPTPVLATICDNTEAIQKEIDAIYSDIKFYPAPKDWGRTHQLSDPTFTQNFIEYYRLTELKRTIQYNLKNYCHEIGFEYNTNYNMYSWMTSFSVNEHARIHDHGLADISGVYYYKTNEVDGDFFFTTPIPFARNSYCFNSEMTRVWKHTPKVGKMLLFPGWLEHGVMANETENLRHSISFNIAFKR